MSETWRSPHHRCVLPITSIFFHPSYGRDGNCDQFVNIYYNPESTTFISGKKCDQWKSIINLTKKSLVESATKPTRIDPEAKKPKSKLQVFADTSSFMTEFPSLRGVVCKYSDQIFTDVTSPFNTHASEKSESRLLFEYILETCHRLCEQHPT